jgi:prephenate dehydrogenase
MELLVVGAGDVGRWVADTLDADVAFADVDPEAAREAAATHGGRAVGTDVERSYDAVCVAVPLRVAAETVAAYAGNAERAVLDVTGVMADPLAAMREHAPDLERLSLHPLFAPANAPGNVAAVVDAGGPVVEAVRDDVAAAGNDVFDTTAEEHDAAMETVQAGAHAAVLAYALAADDVREEFETPVSAGLDDLVETVTGGNPRVYGDIQTTFDGADGVAEAARRLAEADADAFEALYREAGNRE